MRYGLGTLAVHSAQSSVENNVHIQGPHPFADALTQEQTTAIFYGLAARSLLIAGAHRKANQNGENPCLPGKGYGRTDATHTNTWGFHQAFLGLNDFITELGCPRDSCAVIQFHGKADSSCAPAKIFLSIGSADGEDYSDTMTQPYFRIKQEIIKRFSMVSGDVRDPGDDELCDLAATKNVQGRIINGVNEDDVCGPNANVVSGVFVHIEQNRIPFRLDSSYDTWVTVINNSF
jgi:hypothetical protein